MTFQRTPTTILLALVACTLASGCSEIRELSAPNPPPHILPALRVTPVLPANGETTVGIGTDTPAKIDEIVGTDTEHEEWRSSSSSSRTNSAGKSETFDVEYSSFIDSSTERRRPVCLSPCVTTFAPGTHLLRVFSAEPDGPSSVVSLKVERDPLALRYTVAQGTPLSVPAWIAGKALWGLGLAATIIGGLILGVGVGNAPDDDHRLTSGLVGGITAGVGLILFGTGIAIQNAARGELTPGRGSAWSHDPPYLAP